jgi:hypothetical protein
VLGFFKKIPVNSRRGVLDPHDEAQGDIDPLEGGAPAGGFDRVLLPSEPFDQAVAEARDPDLGEIDLLPNLPGRQGIGLVELVLGFPEKFQ